MPPHPAPVSLKYRTAMCLPRNCTDDERTQSPTVVSFATANLLLFMGLTNYTLFKVGCDPLQDLNPVPTYSAGAVIMLILCAMLGLAVLLGTGLRWLDDAGLYVEQQYAMLATRRSLRYLAYPGHTHAAD